MKRKMIFVAEIKVLKIVRKKPDLPMSQRQIYVRTELIVLEFILTYPFEIFVAHWDPTVT